MPGSRLSKTEQKLQDWWSKSGTFPYPPLTGLWVKGDPGLRGIRNLEVQFNYPLTVISGKNGCGKTTILSLAALGFHSPEGHFPVNASRKAKSDEKKSYYTFKDFFFKGPADPDIAGVEIGWRYNNDVALQIRQTRPTIAHRIAAAEHGRSIWFSDLCSPEWLETSERGMLPLPHQTLEGEYGTKWTQEKGRANRRLGAVGTPMHVGGAEGVREV